MVEGLGMIYLKNAQIYLLENQSLILAGCFSEENQDSVWQMLGGTIPQVLSHYSSNVTEAD